MRQNGRVDYRRVRMATISSVGIGSGLDSSGIISKLVALEKAPLTGLATKATKLQTQISVFGAVQSQVAALSDVAARIALPSAWTARTASSSAPTSATITATSTADATSFTLDVDQLAKQQSVSSPTLTAGAMPGAGTLKIRLGAWNTAGTTFTNAATTLAGTAVTGYATALADGDITINGTSIGAISATTTPATRGQQVSAAINAVSGTTGVTATYDTSTGAVALSSASGNDIVLATTTAAKSTVTGLGASGTVSGDVSVTVTATDTVATIAAKINTAGAGVLATAFNDGTNDRLLLRSKSTGTTAGFRIQSDVA
ncbi:MAG: hypothetical protein EBT05_20095, partial [Betaproteobacteria bacterium]|nr:hypothetical protein [Betaproteobacteria bacterium]